MLYFFTFALEIRHLSLTPREHLLDSGTALFCQTSCRLLMLVVVGFYSLCDCARRIDYTLHRTLKETSDATDWLGYDSDQASPDAFGNTGSS